ncbi:MAG: adenylate/guanylate cyclase domain-containing protein [Alphaproteobacteria bacterium]|nr:adenylate/guanylate cyclase domain-containing protein [Alphaproteobacteria bacterium]
MAQPAALNARTRFQETQNTGLKIAVLCRTIAAAIALAWYLSALALTDQPSRWWALSALFVFASIGVAHLSVIGTRHDRWWMKYVLYAVDIWAICAFFVLVPVSRAEEIPQIIAFRAYGIYYLFPLVVLASLSLSWRLVLWSGLMAVIGWWAAFLWVVSGMDQTLSWADIPASATLQDYQTIFLSIDFIGRGNRLEETGLLFIAACILAVAVFRARRVFFAQVNAERKESEEREQRHRITETFGRFVPETVLTQLVQAGGKTAPKQGYGAVLVMDIANFTQFSAEKKPEVVVEALDRILSDAAEQVEAHQGVVISYTGDGLLAAFNAPLPIDAPERAALNTARALQRIAEDHDFQIRVGIAAGDLVSGSIGSKNRLAFTVYGATVNRAARLEAYCKTLGQLVLMDKAIADAVTDGGSVQSVGTHTLRGAPRPEPLFAIA